MQIPNLRGLRELHGLTQKELADASGVSLRSVAGYEGGAHVRPNTARKLAQALNVEVADLVGAAAYPKAEALPSSLQPPLNGFEEEGRRVPTATQLEAIEDLKRYCDVLEESVQREWIDEAIALSNRLAMHAYMKVLVLLAEDEATRPALRPVASRFQDLALKYIRLIKDPGEELEGDLIHIEEYLESRRAS